MIRRRINDFSLSIHIGTDNSCWTDIGLQPIATSFRVSVSSTDKMVDSSAKALLMALLNAELGIALGRSMHRESALRPPVARPGRARSPEGLQLLTKACSLDGHRDLAIERSLAEWFCINPETLSRNDERTALDELQDAIDAVQKRGPYSLKILIGVEGESVAELAWQFGSQWLVALSHRHGHPVWQRPAVALLIAALKAECSEFDGTKR